VVRAQATSERSDISEVALSTPRATVVTLENLVRGDSSRQLAGQLANGLAPDWPTGRPARGGCSAMVTGGAPRRTRARIFRIVRRTTRTA